MTLRSSLLPSAIQVVDSHTGGEPTRVIYAGGPDLGSGSMVERLERFRKDFDHVRRGVIQEPRGNDVLVGGLICPPEDASCSTGVIFFNNFGYLGMCGHGLIGLMVTLKFLEQIDYGVHRVETPVGIVTAELHDNHRVTIQNVPAFRFLQDVEVHVPGYGMVIGDVAWGGNWFFLVKNSSERIERINAPKLTELTSQIQEQLIQQNITGLQGACIDHIELFSDPVSRDNHSRNFVLCPGGAYDRSPCGTGTSAKLACLAADGLLKPEEVWRQESVVGSVFQGSYHIAPPQQSSPHAGSNPTVIPTITGSAYICCEGTILFDPADPFLHGISNNTF